MSSDVLDVLSLIPETLEKMMLFPSAATGHHTGNGGIAGRGSSILTFPVDIAESPSEYVFYLDVPGVPKSEIQVTVEEERVLVISGNRKRKREEEANGQSEEEGCKYLLLERRRMPQRLMRKFRLPEDADVCGIAAKCENGVLTVNVRKLPPPPKPKSVQISVS